MINFIINVKAGGGKALRAKKKISRILNKRGLEYKFHLTKHAKHATEIARELCRNGETDIVAVGGDGTVHEVLNGLENLENIRFGIMPLGSGNDFVYSVNIPKKIKKSLEIILNGKTKPTDFLVCDGVRGLNIIGTGIDVEILKRCLKYKILKGKPKYFLSLIASVIKFRSYDFVYDNGEKSDKKRAFIICCCNGQRFGGGIPICPVAIPDDREMEVVIVNNTKKSKIIGYLFDLMRGKILTRKVCEHYKKDSIRAVFDNPVGIEIDGEIYENLKFDVHIEKNKLNLYRP